MMNDEPSRSATTLVVFPLFIVHLSSFIVSTRDA
jgi:hypothetical protein